MRSTIKPATLIVSLALWSVAAITAAPTAPTSLTAAVSGTAVTLSWGTPAGATGIRLEAGTAPGATNAANAVISPASSYTATNVPPGVYYVRVRAVDPSGESAASNEVVVTVTGGAACATAPSPPISVTAVALGNAVTVQWSAAPAGCPASAFTVNAGSAPGLSNLATVAASGTALNASAPPGTYYVFVRALNASGSSAPSNVVTLIVGGAPGPTPPAGASFGPGQWLVNTQIAPGRYFSDPVSGCYWERQRGLTGSLNDIIANEFVGFDARQWIVDIAPTDLAFEADSQCGTWFNTPRHGSQAGIIPPGVWLVGSQIVPGTYAVSAGSGCYWERLRGFSGNLADIIDNEFVSGSGQQLVTILSSDIGFNNDADCGTWTRINDVRITPDRMAGSAADRALKWSTKYQRRTGLEPSALIKQ